MLRPIRLQCVGEFGFQLDSHCIYTFGHVCTQFRLEQTLCAQWFICTVYITSNMSSNCVWKLGKMFRWTLNPCMLNLDWVVCLLAKRVGGKRCSELLSRATWHTFLIAVSKLFSWLRTVVPCEIRNPHVPQINYYDATGPGSSVGTATAYGPDSPGIEYRWGARFSAPVQTGPEAHSASCTRGSGPFPGVRCGRGLTLTPRPLLAPRSKIEYSYNSTLPKGLWTRIPI